MKTRSFITEDQFSGMLGVMRLHENSLFDLSWTTQTTYAPAILDCFSRNALLPILLALLSTRLTFIAKP